MARWFRTPNSPFRMNREVPMSRHPAVAGYFYQGTAEGLRQQVEGFIVPSAGKIQALGILSPHAGLTYSGSVAGAVYSRLDLPDTFVLVGPNHTGLGAPVSLMARGQWETPLGMVDIDEGLARSIISFSPHTQEDTLAHLREHSLEVQLPFIQYFKGSCRIVPIQMLDVRLETCREVGHAIAKAVQESTSSGVQESRPTHQNADTPQPARINDVLIVASSDMSHYEPAKIAQERDMKAIERILALDPEGLYRTVRDLGISMCGFGPAVTMLTACKALGATKAELIKYTNSGEVSGDYDQVVGYAGIVVS